MQASRRVQSWIPVVGVVLGFTLSSGRIEAQTLNVGLVRDRPVPVADEVKRQMDESRWSLGPLRVDPRLSIGNVGYNNNIFGASEQNATSDLTASASAGVGFIAPIGAATYLRGSAGATYNWYLEQTQLRQVSPTGSLELLLLLNRVRLQVGADLQQSSTVVSSEISVTAPQETRNFKGAISVDILRRLSLIGGYRQSRIKTDVGVEEGFPASLADLNRTETVVRGGLEYAFRGYMKIGAAAEQGQTRFDTDSSNSDYDTRNYLLTARYSQKRFFLDLEGGIAQLEPAGTAGSASQSQETGIYGLFLSYLLNPNTDVRVFTSRRVQPSLSSAADFLVETRTGGGLYFRVGRRVTLFGTGEVGTNTYPGMDSELRPDEDVTKFATGVNFDVWRRSRIGFTVSWENYTSGDPRFDRKIVNAAFTASF